MSMPPTRTCLASHDGHAARPDYDPSFAPSGAVMGDEEVATPLSGRRTEQPILSPRRHDAFVESTPAQAGPIRT